MPCSASGSSGWGRWASPSPAISWQAAYRRRSGIAQHPQSTGSSLPVRMPRSSPERLIATMRCRLRHARRRDCVGRRPRRSSGRAQHILRGKTLQPPRRLPATPPHWNAMVRSGGACVEAPVSVSWLSRRGGQLVGMCMRAPPESLDLVEPLLATVCASTFRCGAVPAAMTTKPSSTTSSSPWSRHSARHSLLAQRPVSTPRSSAPSDAGPMSSAVSRAKLALLAAT